MKHLHHISGRVLLCLLAFFLCSGAYSVRAQQIAVRANALNWALGTPDAGMDIVTGEHTSVSISAFGHYRPYGLDSKLLVLQPEFRYWFNGRPLVREYVGAAAFAAMYDIAGKEHVYVGDAIALGVTGGYVFTMGKCWNLELSGGVGLLGFRHKQYHRHDNYDDYFVNGNIKANSLGYKLFPVKLGVSFIYIIK